MSEQTKCDQWVGTSTYTIDRHCHLEAGHEGSCKIGPKPIPGDLQWAVDALLRLSVADRIGDVRERLDLSDWPDCKSTWEHPDVVAWSEACETLKRYGTEGAVG